MNESLLSMIGLNRNQFYLLVKCFLVLKYRMRLYRGSAFLQTSYSQEPARQMHSCRIPFILRSFDLYLDNDLFCRGHGLTVLYSRHKPPLPEAVKQHPVKTWIWSRLYEFHLHTAIDGNMEARQRNGVERFLPQVIRNLRHWSDNCPGSAVRVHVAPRRTLDVI